RPVRWLALHRHLCGYYLRGGADRPRLAVLAAADPHPVVDLLLPRSATRGAATGRPPDRAGRWLGADGDRGAATAGARTRRSAADPRVDLPQRVRRPYQSFAVRRHRRRHGLSAVPAPAT